MRWFLGYDSSGLSLNFKTNLKPWDTDFKEFSHLVRCTFLVLSLSISSLSDNIWVKSPLPNSSANMKLFALKLNLRHFSHLRETITLIHALAASRLSPPHCPVSSKTRLVSPNTHIFMSQCSSLTLDSGISRQSMRWDTEKTESGNANLVSYVEK